MTRPMSATDRAYTETRSRIIEGELAGGEVITEGNVSAALGISRTPVREAFLRLQAEGLLQLYPKRGAVVVPITVQESFSITEGREVIESFAVTKLMTEHAEVPPALLEELLNLLTQQGRHVRSGDFSAFYDADSAFHLAIVEAAGNPFLTELYASLRDRYRRLSMSTQGRAASIASRHAEHERLVQLMEHGDLDKTLSALRAHLRGGRKDLDSRIRAN